MPGSSVVLVADIGGTNCRFQAWKLDDALRPASMVGYGVPELGPEDLLVLHDVPADPKSYRAHVEKERGHCSVERVACGSGLVRIYDFLRSDEPSQYPPGRMDRTKQVTPADVTTLALEGSDPVAVEALDIFIAIVGAEAGHMALRQLSTGGVYLLKHYPLFVVTNEKVGLLGTRAQAIRILSK
eukprot:scaffold10.g2491.t1